MQLHLSVFLWGFTALLGELISLNSVELVWWRMLLAFLVLLVLSRARLALRQTSVRQIMLFSASGILLALHWVGFYASIKIANPTIALVGLSTTSFFTALLEPIMLRQKAIWQDMLVGLLTIPGMILIFNNTSLEMANGLWIGIGAAIVLAVFSIISKRLIVQRHTNALAMSFYQLGGGWLFLSLLIPFLGFVSFDLAWPGVQDSLLLFIMVVFCTTIPFILSLKALRNLSAFTSNLTLNLEPVYGIILAWIFLDDAKELTPGFVWGVVIVLATVLSYPVLYRYTHKQG